MSLFPGEIVSRKVNLWIGLIGVVSGVSASSSVKSGKLSKSEDDGEDAYEV